MANFTNLLTNGSFETGSTSGWTTAISGTSGGSVSVTGAKSGMYGSYCLEFTMVSGGWYFAKQTFNTTPNHIYMATGVGYASSSDCCPMIYVNTATEPQSTFQLSSTNRQTIVFDANGATSVTLLIEDDTLTGGNAYVDGFMVLDLTAMFGSTYANSIWDSYWQQGATAANITALNNWLTSACNESYWDSTMSNPYITPTAVNISSIVGGVSGGSPIATVNWVSPTEPTYITQFMLFWSTTSGSGPYTVIESISPSATSCVVNYNSYSMSVGTTYYFFLVSINDSCNGEDSIDGSTYSFDAGIPSAPTNLAASPTNYNNAPALQITWTAPTNVASSLISYYTIYRNGVSYHQTTTGETGSTTYLDTNVAIGTQYTYYMTASTPYGTSPNSSNLVYTVPNVPGAVALSVANNPQGNGIISTILSWPSAATSTIPLLNYNIYRNSNLLSATAPSGALSFVDSTVASSTPYTYQVAAVNAIGLGTMSNSVAISSGALPTAPLTLTISQVAQGLQLSIESPALSGTPAFSGYTLYRTTSNVDGSDPVQTSYYITYLNAQYTQFTDSTNITTRTMYQYYAVAMNTYGQGDPSPTVTFIIPGVPLTPQNFTVSGMDGIYPILTWTPPSDDGGGPIEYYTLYGSVSGTSIAPVATVDASVFEAIHIDTAAGTTYNYALTCTNSEGTCAVSATYSYLIPSGTVDTKMVALQNLLTNGSFEYIGTSGWSCTGAPNVISSPINLFYENCIALSGGSSPSGWMMQTANMVPVGHTVLTTCRGFSSGASPYGYLAVGPNDGSNSQYLTANFPTSTSRVYVYGNTLAGCSGSNASVYIASTSSMVTFDGVMLIDLTDMYGHGAVFTTESTPFAAFISMIDGFAGGYVEGADSFEIPKSINGTMTGGARGRITIRGQSTAPGFLDLFFKDENGVSLWQNKYWFTSNITSGVDRSVLDTFWLNPNSYIFTYATPLGPYQAPPPGPPGSGYVAGWPVYTRYLADGVTVAQTVNLLYSSPIVTDSVDDIGAKTTVDFIFNPVRFVYNNSGQYLQQWSRPVVTMANDGGLEGFGTLQVTSDYSIYIRMNNQGQVFLTESFNGSGDYMSLNFLVDSWFVGNNSVAAMEDIPKAAPYFRIPIYAGDDLPMIRDRILNGASATTAMPISCLPLVTQINNYFNLVSQASNSLVEPNSFNVTATFIKSGTEDFDQGTSQTVTNTYDYLCVRITVTNEMISHDMSCYADQNDELFIRSVCNQYYVGENTYELRSYYDMYGIDKPVGNSIAQGYTPLAYGFKFSLDYITDYSETESSTIDVTPIPGQSSAKAIGIDAIGCVRDITINGTRVDNCNIWTFHVPWEVNGMDYGVIYTGTSNWGWVKFMKATLGCFQMTSGPYRLVMMTVPSSAQMQYFPTLDGTYQYSDGTLVMQAGWEDMCYVMIENFTYSRSEDMINAIQYSLKLKRVAPLMANR